ncbi:helix-turn-helix transcriptional regulator [Salmonella enterica subsp. enterica serovar Chandans]|nr:helix-turn-helix transcriptional regulator [Salmonella enterica subsp. enterica serovar Chandans]
MKQIGDRIREERKKFKLNQTDFAKLLDSSRSAQAIYERGESLPGSAYLIKMSELGIDVQYILTGRHTPTPDGIVTASQEEKALLENYRAMDKAAQLNMQTVSAAFAQANLIKNKAKDGTNE